MHNRDMTLIYLGIYTLVLGVLWGFFIIAKIHAYKFKNFSHNIKKVTRMLLILLIILTIIGYVVIIFGSEGSQSNIIDFNSDKEINEINY